MRKQGIVVALLSSIGSIGVAGAAESGPVTTLGFAPSYSTGKYGSTTDTKILYLPFFAKVQLDDLILKLTVPYISAESAGAVLSGGSVISHPGRSGTKTKTATTTESGLGDIWLEGRYRIHGSGGAVPDFVPYAKVKLGTASYRKGLGTGENDYESGLGLEWALGRNWFPFADGGYRIVGEPAGLHLNDFATYDAGVMYQITDRNFVTAMFAGHQSAQPGGAAAADTIVAWSYRAGSGIGLQAFLDKGLSDGSPDFALGVSVEKRF